LSDHIAEKLTRRLNVLKALRTPHETVWQDCFDYSFPERGSGFFDEHDDSATLQAKRAQLLDSTSTDAGEILASAVMSGGSPSNSRWFGLTTGGESQAERTWLDDAAEMVWLNIHGSNYDAEAMDCCLDLIAAGWFVLFIAEGEETAYKFEAWPMSQCYVSASTPGGQPDQLIREFQLTVEQAITTYGEHMVSQKLRDLMGNGKRDEKVRFIQCIEPRSKYASAGLRSVNMPFSSIHIECDQKKVVRESGFHELPFVVPRWAKIPCSDYAIGPMFRALPDIKQLNRLVKMEDANIELAVTGMWIAEDDGVLNPRTVRVGPRKIIVANSVDSMKELKSGADFNVSFTKKDQLQAAIRRILRADQLAPQDGPVRTAYEISVRVQQIRQLLGPIYGRLQAEWYSPMVRRCFGIAYRAGALGTPPESLAGRMANVTFQSPMAKAQKLEEVTAVETTLMTVGQLAAAKQDPAIWDTVDVEESVRIIIDGRGAPARIGRSDDDIEAIRAAREEAAQEANSQTQQQAMAQPVMEQMARNMAT